MTYFSQLPSPRMRSMWDSIYAHTSPVDDTARRVAGMEPRWADDNKPLTIADCVNVTRPAPGNLKDRRGYRSKFHKVIGFADLREKARTRRRRPSNKGLEMRLYGRTSAARQALGKATIVEYAKEPFFYVLRIDGVVCRVSAWSMHSALSQMDDQWIQELAAEMNRTGDAALFLKQRRSAG